jgi:hypothetical protein
MVIGGAADPWAVSAVAVAVLNEVAWSSRHGCAAHNPGIEKAVQPSTAGVRRRIVSTEKRRRQGIREQLWLRLAAWDS